MAYLKARPLRLSERNVKCLVHHSSVSVGSCSSPKGAHYLPGMRNAFALLTVP